VKNSPSSTADGNGPDFRVYIMWNRECSDTGIVDTVKRLHVYGSHFASNLNFLTHILYQNVWGNR